MTLGSDDLETTAAVTTAWCGTCHLVDEEFLNGLLAPRQGKRTVGLGVLLFQRTRSHDGGALAGSHSSTLQLEQ